MMSQNYHPLVKENVYWDVLQGNSQNLYTYDGGSRFFFDGDTLIGNHIYSKLVYYPFEIIYNPYPSFYVDTTIVNFQNYIREDTLTRKTYIKESWSGASEELLFDFSLNIGDTLNSTYTTDGSPLIVDTITNTTLLNGAIRKKWLFDNGHFYIEGIGGDEGFFLPILTGLGFWSETNCVNDNGVHLYGNRCFTVLKVDEITMPENNLKIYPNPVHSEMQIELLNTTIGLESMNLYDLLGKKLFSVDLNRRGIIHLTDLEKGCYLGVFYFENGHSISRKIIKE